MDLGSWPDAEPLGAATSKMSLRMMAEKPVLDASVRMVDWSFGASEFRSLGFFSALYCHTRFHDFRVRHPIPKFLLVIGSFHCGCNGLN